MLERLLEAAYSREKKVPLKAANLQLEVLRHLWRLAYELRVIPMRQFRHGVERMDDLGRQLGKGPVDLAQDNG